MKLRKRTREPGARIRSIDTTLALVERARRYFDPRTDIPSEKIDEILEKMASKQHKGAYEYYRPASLLIFLYPEMRDEIDLPSEVYRNINARLYEMRREGQWAMIAEDVQHIQLMFPEHYDEIDLSDRDFHGVASACQDEKEFFAFSHEDRNDGISNSASLAAELCIIFPGRRSELTFINKEYYLEAKATLDEYWENEDYSSYAALASNLVILFPERKSEFKLDEQKYELMKEALLQLSGLELLKMVKRLAILAADKIQITREGIQLVYGDGFEDVPTLPERNIT